MDNKKFLNIKFYLLDVILNMTSNNIYFNVFMPQLT